MSCVFDVAKAGMQTIPTHRERTGRRHRWQWRGSTHAVCEALSNAQVRLVRVDSRRGEKRRQSKATKKDFLFLGPGRGVPRRESYAITNHVWQGFCFEYGVLFCQETFGGRAVALGRGVLTGAKAGSGGVVRCSAGSPPQRSSSPPQRSSSPAP
jgi:hypothetical protein